MSISKFVKPVLVIATAAFLFFHATAAAFVIFSIVKINACPFAHTIMNLHGKARRHCHVDYGEDGKEELFHCSKVLKICKIFRGSYCTLKTAPDLGSC